MTGKYNFSTHFNKANLFSLIIFSLSVILIFFKGLNYGIDFKGGTLIELRVSDKNISISEIRYLFQQNISGDLNVKEFGEKGDFLVKVEKTSLILVNFIPLKTVCLTFKSSK